MKRVTLGRTDINVSDWCLGTMTYGEQTGTEDAFAQMDMALDARIDFFDTAEAYPVNPMSAQTAGRTEEIIGDWLVARGNRARVKIATKAAGDTMTVRKGEGFSGDNLAVVLDGNLRRLKTDYIDLYQLHWPMRGSYMFRQNWTFDPSGQDSNEVRDHMAGVLEALDKAVKAGKVRAVGLSNESAWGTMRWLQMAEEMGAPRMATMQNEYSLLCRLYDTDMAELSHHEDVTLFSFSPLAAGLLTGKYRGGAVPEGSRLAINGTLGGRHQPRAHAAVEAYADIAARHGMALDHMAMAFQRTRPYGVSAIFGATTAAQLEHLLKGADLELPDEVLAEIDTAHRAHPMPY